MDENHPFDNSLNFAPFSHRRSSPSGGGMLYYNNTQKPRNLSGYQVDQSMAKWSQIIGSRTLNLSIPC